MEMVTVLEASLLEGITDYHCGYRPQGKGHYSENDSDAIADAAAAAAAAAAADDDDDDDDDDHCLSVSCMFQNHCPQNPQLYGFLTNHPHFWWIQAISKLSKTTNSCRNAVIDNAPRRCLTM